MKNRFTEEQIIGVLKEVENGVKVAELAASTGSSTPTITNEMRNSVT